MTDLNNVINQGREAVSLNAAMIDRRPRWPAT